MSFGYILQEKPKFKSQTIPTPEEIDEAQKTYENYLKELELAEAEFSIEVFECKQKGKTPPQNPREVEKPSKKVFRTLAFARLRSKSSLEKKEKRMKFLESLDMPYSKVRSQSRAINEEVINKTAFIQMHPPGFIPSTSKLGDTSKVIQIPQRHDSCTSIRSKILFHRTIDISKQPTKEELEKIRKEQEEQEALIELKRFDERDKNREKELKERERKAEERVKDSKIKSQRFCPQPTFVE